MASLNQWKTDSTASGFTVPPQPTLTAAQTLSALQIPPWGKPTTSVPFLPTPPATGTMVNPYIYPLPPPAVTTTSVAAKPIPPGPPSQPTPPTPPNLATPGPQTPPMGPMGPGGGFGGLMQPPQSPPSGTHGVAYVGFQFTANGGTAPVTWAATGVPAGMSLSSTGSLTGTPTTAGTATLVVTATDSKSATSQQTYTLVVA